MNYIQMTKENCATRAVPTDMVQWYLDRGWYVVVPKHS